MKFLESEKGVMLWGDNEPYFYHANKILQQINTGNGAKIQLTGDSNGE